MDKCLRPVIGLTLAVALSACGAPDAGPAGSPSGVSVVMTPSLPYPIVLTPDPAPPFTGETGVASSGALTRTDGLTVTNPMIDGASSPLVALNPLSPTDGISGTISGGSLPAEVMRVPWLWQFTVRADGTKVDPRAAQQTPDEPSKYNLLFVAEGMVAVNADCNHARHTYRTDGVELAIAHGGAAPTDCPPPSLSGAFLTDLAAVSSFRMDGASLVLEFATGAGSMAFARGDVPR